MSFKEGRLGNPVGETFVPFHWIAEDEGFLLVNAVQTFYRFARKQDGTPSHFVRLNDGEVYDYNGGDDDPPGPNKPDWDRHLGKYQLKAFGQPAMTVEVRKQNGNLYINYYKLTEFQHEGRNHDLIISMTHIHVGEDLCLEILVCRGRAGDIRNLAEKISAIKGVRHGEVSMRSVAETEEHHRLHPHTH